MDQLGGLFGSVILFFIEFCFQKVETVKTRKARLTKYTLPLMLKILSRFTKCLTDMFGHYKAGGLLVILRSIENVLLIISDQFFLHKK